MQDENWQYYSLQRQEETLEENQAEVVDSFNLAAFSRFWRRFLGVPYPEIQLRLFSSGLSLKT